MNDALKVHEFTRLLKQDLEARFKSVHVVGEISNFSRPASGHVYFTLKDDKASLSCVMWRSAVAKLKELPKHGDLVEVKGRLTLYEPRGSYQLDVRSIKQAGLGDLEKRFQMLKTKLYEEGLFDIERKKELPFLPRRIALVTSFSGAARHDMERSIRNRFPPADIVVVGCHVQGAEAIPGIVAGIKKAQTLKNVDVIVCGRGGGSLEDLWAFNEEDVVRAFAACTRPIISAVGHEVDITLSDFAADVRSLTPTGVGELIVPEWSELWEMLATQEMRLARGLKNSLEKARFKLKLIQQSPAWNRPRDLLNQYSQFCDDAQKEFYRSVKGRVKDSRLKIEGLEGQIKALSPLGILERGYSVVTDEHGNLVSIEKVKKGQRVRVRLQGGSLGAEVKEIDRG